MVRKTENVFVFLSLWSDKSFRLRITYPTFSLDAAECVILRDEHKYFADAMRHWFILKRWGPRKIVP